jgi:hypothetical protein
MGLLPEGEDIVGGMVGEAEGAARVPVDVIRLERPQPGEDIVGRAAGSGQRHP